jgi:hypothetical protein
LGIISNGSFAILIDIKEVKTKLQQPANKKSSAKDEIIRNYIKQNYKSSSLFSDNQKIFFEFVFSLKL